MKNKMNLNKFEKLFFIIISLFIIVFFFLFFLFIKGIQKNDQLLIRYNSDRLTSNLIEAYHNNTLLEILKENTNIIGFGIYKNSGDIIFSYGIIPAKINIENLSYDFFKLNNSDNTCEIIRPIGKSPPPRMGMRSRMHNMHEPPKWKPKNKKIVYSKISVGYIGKRRGIIFNFFLIITSILLLGILLLITYLFKKNQDYRKRINKQNELARLGEVSRTLSHEIKNPLGAIQIHTAYLKKILPDNYKKEFKIIEEEVARIKLLTNRIGNFLQDAKGKPEIIEVIPYLEDITKKFNNNIILTNNVKNNIKIFIDIHRFRSILENLLKNAIESSPENVEIEIIISEEKNFLIIQILDNGEGLPDDYSEKIFNPYFTTKNIGSGIGLAIVKKFVEAANGKIIIKPRQLKGTEVKLILKKGDTK